jgi:uncharacterized protein
MLDLTPLDLTPLDLTPLDLTPLDLTPLDLIHLPMISIMSTALWLRDGMAGDGAVGVPMALMALMAPMVPIGVSPPAVVALSIWAKTSGTWLNAATILLGTGLGMALRQSLPRPMQQVITQGLGLFTMFLGITMANSLLKVKAGAVDGILLGLLAMVGGGLVGEWWQLDQRLQALGDGLKQRLRGGGQFAEGFTAASLLFCVGPMAIVGSLNNGLAGDPHVLIVKAVMDGLAALALSGSYGIGVGASLLPLLAYQGGLSLIAGWLAPMLPDPANDPLIFLVSGVGGLMVLGIGLNLLEVVKIRVASFLPALLWVPIGFWIARSIG